METSSQSNIVKFEAENKESSDNSRIPVTKKRTGKKIPRKRGFTKKKCFSKKKKNKKIIKLTTKSNKRVKIENLEFSIDNKAVDFYFNNFK